MKSPPQREEALFQAAVQLAGAERIAFLNGACHGNPILRQRLETLLAAHDAEDSFLEPQEHKSDSEPLKTMKLELPDAHDEDVGTTIGRYKLREKVGEGGCGVVYVAEQTEPVRRRVALKVIKLGMDTKQVVARFEAERQALALMDHPNIAKVLDAGTTERGRPYFIMELVRGIKITEYCDQHNLPTKERLDLFIQVCQAIQHAHQKGIIHRDIKPSNILVTLHDGVPVTKVIDFGIAKATEGRLTDATVYTQLHQFIGTPAYMSPEQAEMSGLDIDTRSDIYSLGVLLYELLTGKTPFDANELMSLGIDAMRKTIREKEPARPSTKLATLQGDGLTTTARRRSVDRSKLLHQLKGDLDWIVMKCLEKDRARRYDTANGLAMDIKRHLENEPVVARPPSKLYEFQKTVRRHKFGFAATAAIILVLAAGITLTTWQAHVARKAQRETEAARKSEQTQRLQAQQKQAEAEAERQRADEQAHKASESQQQSRRLLYAADMNLVQHSLKLNNLGRARRLLDRHRPKPGEEDLRGWEWRYLWQLTRSSALVTLTHQPVRGADVSFSSDGNHLAVGWQDGRVDLWDVPTRRFIRSLANRNVADQSGHVAFSPAGNLLAVTASPKAVALYDLDSGRESPLWAAPNQGTWDVRDLAFSQDGSGVVIYAGSTPEFGDAVWVVKVASAQIEGRYPTVYNGNPRHGVARLSPDNRRLYLTRLDALGYSSIECLDLASGKELWQAGDCFGLTTLAISPDGRVVVSRSGYDDPSIGVWDAETGRLLTRLEGHTGRVCALAFTRDGRRLISAATDQSIRLWDTRTWTEIRVLRGHSDEVCAVAISEPGKLIASAGADGNLMLWKEDGGSVTDGYIRLPENLGRYQVLALDNARVLLLPPGKPPELVDLKNEFPARSLPEIGSSADVLGWFGTNILCHWNGTNQILVRELRGAEFIQLGVMTLNSGQRPTTFAYNPMRQLLAWTEGHSSTSVYLASLAARGRRIELKSDISGFYRFRFSNDGKYLGAAAGNRTNIFLRVWNVESGQIVASVDGFISDATFAKGGREMVVAITLGNDHEVRFYDLVHPEREPHRVPGRSYSGSLAVSPDGGLVALSTFGGEVRLFDAARGELIDSFQGHLDAMRGINFSSDGRRLVSASGGREAIKLWDVGTRQELLTLGGTGQQLYTARWTADGNVILAGPPWQACRAPSWAEIHAAEAKDKAEVQQP